MNKPARIAALEEWVRDKEGENLEFKEARNRFSFEDLAKCCAGLAIEKGAEQLPFAVHNEEYSNIRELPVPLPSASKTDEPIELHVVAYARQNTREFWLGSLSSTSQLGAPTTGIGSRQCNLSFVIDRKRVVVSIPTIVKPSPRCVHSGFETN